MKKIEADTLDSAYIQATEHFECSVTELDIEIIQQPSKGFLGLFKKPAIIVALKKVQEPLKSEETCHVATPEVAKKAPHSQEIKATSKITQTRETSEIEQAREQQVHLNDTILPASFVTDQDDEEGNTHHNTANAHEKFYEDERHASDVVDEIKSKINALFKQICFDIDEIEVGVYDEETILITFNGKDAALLIGKEGYRYKALSYMFFNWINSQYNLQLRLEVAEFLKNQEESISNYLVGVCENIDRDGRAQTKILDGILVQIALVELRERYPNKYVAIRSTKDGNKFIIINEYNNY